MLQRGLAAPPTWSCCKRLTQREKSPAAQFEAPYAFRMKNLALTFAAVALVGCASNSQMVDLENVMREANGAASTSGPSTGPGYVASGGTGYLPCPAVQVQGTPPITRPECKQGR
jgi:hypothetical protein